VVQEVATSKEKYEVRKEVQPRNQINLNPIRRLFDRDRSIPQKHIEPYVTKGQVVADLGCGSGYYKVALAECVGPEGRVYAVDLNERAVRALEEKADKRGYRNVEAHASSASDARASEKSLVFYRSKQQEAA
jgi:ubiquinone/menaquinone biosynthesis C-methylase UbiE